MHKHEPTVVSEPIRALDSSQARSSRRNRIGLNSSERRTDKRGRSESARSERNSPIGKWPSSTFIHVLVTSMSIWPILKNIWILTSGKVFFNPVYWIMYFNPVLSLANECLLFMWHWNIHTPSDIASASWEFVDYYIHVSLEFLCLVLIRDILYWNML